MYVNERMCEGNELGGWTCCGLPRGLNRDVMKASLDKVVKACPAQLELQDVEKVCE